MANYYIGANDEHGQNPFTAGKRTPVMPYINTPIYENQFNRPTKIKFMEGCLRNGLAVYDVKPELTDTSITTRVRRINSQNLTLLVTFGYNAFGNGTSFNSAQGIAVYFAQGGRRPEESRVLSEEIFEKLVQNLGQRGNGVFSLQNVGVLQSVNCPSALVESGYMTNFYEAKLMLDPDYQTLTAESTLQGVCQYLGENYVERNNIANYPTLRRGERGNYVYLLQLILNQNGASLAVDGVFGAETYSAVQRFQQQNGLAVDGIVGQRTWQSLLVLPPLPTLQQGNRGVYVKYLQQKLTSKLYPLGATDGIFGRQTRQAVIAFQQENNLSPDGIAGPLTWAQLTPIGGGRPLD